MSQVPKIGRLVIFLHYIKKKVLKLLLRSTVIQNIQIFYGHPVMFFLLVYYEQVCGYARRVTEVCLLWQLRIEVLLS